MGTREYRFHEGCLDHKWGSSYRRLWMVMKNNIIYIFRDRPFIPENHEGTLTVDSETRFELGTEKPNNYKFTLFTKNKRNNAFKSDKKSERDLWRGYIVGVARQIVPDNLDLPRDIINKIKQDVANYHLANGTDGVVIKRRISGGSGTQHSIGSGRSNPNRQSIVSDDSGVVSSINRKSLSNSNSSGSLTIQGLGGGPFMRHKFCNNPDDPFIPSWFFEACTREKAESYLAIAAEKNFGNTLMRESTKFKQDGSYVISKRNVKDGRSWVEHYEVIRVDRGYKIKVENQHDAMRNLTDVMNYFVQTSGTYATTPLTTNRLIDFGMAEDPYNTGRIQPTDTVADVLAEPAPDYEEPVQTRSQQISRQLHKTVTPQTAKFNIHHARHSYNTERHARDYKDRPGKPTMDDIENNIKTAAALHMFDQTIDPFDEPAREEDYINLKDLQREDDFLPPPPPVPHTAIPPSPEPHGPPLPARHAYINDPHKQAPPRHERAKSVPNLAERLQSVQLNPVLNKKEERFDTAAVIDPPPPSLKHVSSAPLMPSTDPSRDGVPTPQQLGLRKTNFQKPDPSVGEIMKPTGKSPVKKTMNIPPIPVSKTQQLGLKPTRISQSENETIQKNEPEVDVSRPGGVSSIASRFERNSKEIPASQRDSGGGINQSSRALPPPVACPNTTSHMYCNDPSQANTDNPYDDGMTPQIPEPCRQRGRSKSTPTISPEIRDRLKVGRLAPENSSFIRKLEAVVGASQPKVGMTLPNRRSRISNQEDDELYEELPDLPN